MRQAGDERPTPSLVFPRSDSQVFDIWESREAFEAFGPALMPILTGLGVEVGEPMVARVHNVIEG